MHSTNSIIVIIIKSKKQRTMWANFSGMVALFDSVVSMENITTDMHELEKGMELTKREYTSRKDSRDCPIILKDFLTNAEERFRKLVADVKTAQVCMNLLQSCYINNLPSECVRRALLFNTFHILNYYFILSMLWYFLTPSDDRYL